MALEFNRPNNCVCFESSLSRHFKISKCKYKIIYFNTREINKIALAWKGLVQSNINI